jgi:hypothetical protein
MNMVHVKRPAVAIELTVYPDGEVNTQWHTGQNAGVPEVKRLIDSVRQEIATLPSLLALQGVVAGLPQRAEDPFDPDEAQEGLDGAVDDARQIQEDREQPVVVVLRFDSQGMVYCGFNVAPEIATAEVKQAMQQLAALLPVHPLITTLQDHVRYAAGTAN